ncbi:hypothetical protein E4U21_000929, partial [Claviceps maximensis]
MKTQTFVVFVGAAALQGLQALLVVPGSVPHLLELNQPPSVANPESLYKETHVDSRPLGHDLVQTPAGSESETGENENAVVNLAVAGVGQKTKRRHRPAAWKSAPRKIADEGGPTGLRNEGPYQSHYPSANDYTQPKQGPGEEDHAVAKFVILPEMHIDADEPPLLDWTFGLGKAGDPALEEEEEDPTSPDDPLMPVPDFGSPTGSTATPTRSHAGHHHSDHTSHSHATHHH